MGYTTDFGGFIIFKNPLSEKQRNYINLLSETRRMKRDVKKLMEVYKGEHGNPFVPKTATPEEIYGVDGEFFARDDGIMGQDNDDPSIIDFNRPPSTQPGLWCQWIIYQDRLEWDGGEKFYNYIEWLEYLMKTFFIPWGCKMDGEIQWYGEDRDDIGKIKVRNNEVFVIEGRLAYDEE